jgi:hypothetical protein
MFCQNIGLSPNHTLFFILSPGIHFSSVFLYRTLKFATKNSLDIVKQSRNGLEHFEILSRNISRSRGTSLKTQFECCPVSRCI